MAEAATLIAPGLLVVHTSVADGKAGVIAGESTALAVDAGIDDAEGQAVLDAARSLERSTIMLTYTHGHIDHALGGTVFKGHQIVATPAIGEHMAAQIDAWAERNGEPVEQLEARLGWPTMAADPGLELDLGGRRVRLIDAPGHAPGTVCVHDPDAGILFGGDTVVTNIPPAFTDGDSGELEQTLRRLSALDLEILVPGHGPVIQGRSRIRAAITWSADYLARCRAHVADNAGVDPDELVARAPWEMYVGEHLVRDDYRNDWRHEQTIRRIAAERAAAEQHAGTNS